MKCCQQHSCLILCLLANTCLMVSTSPGCFTWTLLDLWLPWVSLAYPVAPRAQQIRERDRRIQPPGTRIPIRSPASEKVSSSSASIAWRFCSRDLIFPCDLHFPPQQGITHRWWHHMVSATMDVKVWVDSCAGGNAGFQKPVLACLH
jgi:hypothetical protein